MLESYQSPSQSPIEGNGRCVWYSSSLARQDTTFEARQRWTHFHLLELGIRLWNRSKDVRSFLVCFVSPKLIVNTL